MKPSLLLITGWAHGTDTMKPLADQLSSEFHVQILTGAQVLDEKRIPDADGIVGWSMGGMLAMQYLPASCRKLVLISSTARFCSTDGYPCGVPERTLRRMMTQLKRSPDRVLAEFRTQVWAPRCPPPSVAARPERLEEGLAYLQVTDLRIAVADIRIPVLLLHGLEDRIIPPLASDWLAKALPDAAFVPLPGEGHLPEPQALCLPIRSFLEIPAS